MTGKWGDYYCIKSGQSWVTLAAALLTCFVKNGLSDTDGEMGLTGAGGAAWLSAPCGMT